MLSAGAGGVSEVWSIFFSGALDGMMMSIFVAIHNQLGHNRFFLEETRRQFYELRGLPVPQGGVQL